VRLALLALAYFAAAKASLVFAIPPGYATAVWLPSGIAVAAVMRWGTRCWPGLWLGAALANFSVNLSSPAAVGIATGNTLEALCVGALAAGLIGSSGGFQRPQGVIWFAALAAVASAIAASVGVGALLLTGAIAEGAFAIHWYTWWQGDATGILVVTPCLLAWAGLAGLPPGPGQRRELATFLVLFTLALLAVFSRAPTDRTTLAIAFLTMPLFSWAACRLSQRAITTSVLAATVLAVWCTVNGRGPFAGGELNDALLNLQAFTSAAALIALALSAFTHGRDLALRSLRASNVVLDEAIQAQGAALSAREHESARVQELAHAGVWLWDSRSDRMTWSDELCRIHGIEPGAFTGGVGAYLARVDLRDRERMRLLVHRALFEGQRWEAIERIVRGDGAVRMLHSRGSVSARRRDEPARLRCYSLDITEQVRLEQVQAAQHETAQMLQYGASAEGAVRETLRILSEKLGCRAARYWGVEELGAAQGDALAVRAWREQHARWGEAGARASFAFPVGTAGAVHGVVELSGGAIGHHQGELLEMASALGALLGEFMQRKHAEQQLRELTERLGG